MRELVLIRHGATVWNRQRRFQGHSDVPLAEEGYAQARAISAALHETAFDAVYSSDLARALETARLLAEAHAVDITPEPRLREFDFGAWEGLTWEEIVATRPHLRETGATAAELYAPEDGESFAQLCARVADFLDDLLRAPHAAVAVVTHAGPLHALLTVCPVHRAGEAIDPLRVAFSPGGITRLAMEEGGARLITLDDIRHLDPAGRP